MKSAIALLSTFVLIANLLVAQQDSILDQGVYRTFIVHEPLGYSADIEYPIVLNLHGLNSSAAGQRSYTQFDDVADSLGFIVVYPNGISNSWTTVDDSDADFLSNLVDTIRSNYSSNDCLFVTGMSLGGFMTYKFATTTAHDVTAIAVGSGNMSNALQNESASSSQVPVMHFHGTEDNLVTYNGTAIISPVESTIQWWVEHNNCNTTPEFTALPNSNLADNSTVEKYHYSGGTNGSEVTLYKILNGGHTWSGAIPIPLFGNTNQDINQSALIGSYFADFCPTSTGVNDETIDTDFKIFPNPFNAQLVLTSSTNEKLTLIIYNSLFHQVLKTNFYNSTIIPTEKLSNGIYFYELWNSDKQIESGKVIKN